MWYVFKILSDLHYSFNFSFSLTDDFNCVFDLILKFKVTKLTYNVFQTVFYSYRHVNVKIYKEI